MSRKQAFTLIELLVVIAIIAILAAILFPVLAQAKMAAKKTQDLSNMRQVGVSFMMYAQDNDDRFPLTSFPAAKMSWAIQCQPYIKNWGLFRSPGDNSAFWPPANTQWPDLNLPDDHPDWTKFRVTSYLLNAFMSGGYENGRFSTTNAIESPSSTIYVSLAQDEVAPRDHFHPFYWGDPSENTSNYMQNLTWDKHKDETKEIKLTAFSEGSNYTYTDGHAKFGKWRQLWWRDIPNEVYAGNFDPRNTGSRR